MYNLGNGGSQFTMTLWMGYGQNTKNDNNGNRSHSRFPGFANIPTQHMQQGHGELGPPHACRVEAGAGSDHDGTRNMSRGVNLLYLFRYQIKGGMAVLSHDFVST